MWSIVPRSAVTSDQRGKFCFILISQEFERLFQPFGDHSCDIDRPHLMFGKHFNRSNRTLPCAVGLTSCKNDGGLRLQKANRVEVQCREDFRWYLDEATDTVDHAMAIENNGPTDRRRLMKEAGNEQGLVVEHRACSQGFGRLRCD